MPENNKTIIVEENAPYWEVLMRVITTLLTTAGCPPTLKLLLQCIHSVLVGEVQASGTESLGKMNIVSFYAPGG